MHFYQQALAYFIDKHHAVQIESHKFASFLQIFYYLQLCGLLLDVEQENFYAGTLINILNIFYYAGNVIKPYKYLLEFKEFRLYCFMLPGLLLIIQQIGLIVDQISQKLKQNRKREAQEKKIKRVSETQKILSILFQTHIYLFSLYSIDLVIISIVEANQSDDLFITIICNILLIFEILFVFLNIMSSESVDFKSYPLQLSQPLTLHYFNFFLIVLSIVMSYQNSPQTDILKHILIFFVFGIYLKIEISKRVSPLQKIANIILSLGFSYNLVGFMLLDYYPEYQIALVIILCPFLINILTKLQEKQNEIDFSQNRKIEKIYNNLQLLSQRNSSKNTQLDILIMLRMKQDFGSNPFQSELINFNQTILKSQNSSKINWYIKYIGVKLSIMEYSVALCLVHHLSQQLLFCDLQKKYVKYILNFTFLQRLQIEQIKSKIYENIFRTIERNYETTRSKSSNFIEYKVCSIKMRQSLYALFLKKEAIYNFILEQKQSSQKKIFDLSIELISEALTFKTSLQQQFRISKTNHIKQMLIILYVEFFNQIVSAEQLRNWDLQHTEEIEQIQLEQMEYLGMKIFAEEQEVSIFDMSKNFMKALGYRKIKDIKEIDFKSFFPVDYYQTHQNQIKEFLQTGQSKLIEKIHFVFIRGFDDFYYETQFLLTFLSNYENGIKFYCFAQVQENQPRTLFINQKKQIAGMTSSFLSLLNENNIYLSQQQLMGKEISKFIKNFQQLQLNKVTSQSIFGSLSEMNFIIKQSLNMIELQVIQESQEILNNDESVMVSENQIFKPNQESEVMIPILSSEEDIQYPKSTLTKRDNYDRKLNESCVNRFTILKSQVNSLQKSGPSSEVQHQYVAKEVPEQDYEKDQQSSKFSRGFIDQAIYHKKYFQLETFANEIKKKLIIMYFIFVLTALLVNFSYQVINIFFILPQYSKVNQDADSLSVKSYFITPIHSCTSSQYQALAYLLYAAYKVITPQVFLDKLKFSEDSIHKSYDFLKSSFISQLNNQNLQSFFTDKYLEFQQIEGQSLVSRNISLKNALYYYYQSQFFIIHTNGNVSSLKTIDFQSYVSNNFVYYMANVLVVDNYFNNLSQWVLDSITERTFILKNNYTELFLKLFFLQILLFFLTMSIVINIYTMRKKIWAIFGKINIFAANLQLQQIIKIKQLLNQEKAYYYYSFDIKIWERDLQQISQFYNLKLNQIYTNGLNFPIPALRIFSLYAALSLVFLLPLLILELVNEKFLQKYESSCNLLKQLSEISSAVVAVYELRETNYLLSGKTPYFYFFQQSKRLENNVKILEELDKIQQFQENITSIDFNTLLANDDFISLISEISNSSLCNYLVHFSQELAIQHCNKVYSGVMNLGLINTISEIYKQITLEYENSQGFQAIHRKSIGPFEEIEAGLITSDAIFYIQKSLYNDIIAQTEIMLLTHQVINYCCIFFDVFSAIIQISLILPLMLSKQKISRNLICLVPKYQLFVDQKFETELRWLMNRFN